ncbi:Stp1/IreP family PP2C-type Ser/Thr phosphatase [Haliangium sp.]|uniref:Stp1/IreP family PP2C-type Ser/Thr phosphatase n=1 Tax=Haliangium sp. TaxID=2663208 RepID=UPI003D0AC1E1
MRVRFAGATDIGRKRSHNEDSVSLPADTCLAIVADGMGGHASGELASKIAVETIVRHFRQTANAQTLTWPYKVDRGTRSDVNRLTTAIMLANIEICEHAHRESHTKGMGTTVVALHLLDDTAIIGHVGDSRVYLYRDRTLSQLTEDHSLINDYIKMKRVTAEEAENWRHKNVIVRALGMKESVQVDIISESPRVGDVYLLCSDGLSGMITDDHMAAVLAAESDLEAAVQRLIDDANEAGGIDNITAVLARIEPP